MTAATGVAVFVWDDDRNYVAVNDAGCTLVGLPRETLLQMNVGDLTENRAAPYFQQVQRRDVSTGSLTLTRPDGTDLALDWVTFRTRVAGLPYMASVCWPSVAA